VARRARSRRRIAPGVGPAGFTVLRRPRCCGLCVVDGHLVDDRSRTNPGDVALATGVVPTVRYGNYGGDRCPVCGYRDLLGHGRCRSWSGYREVQPAPACGAADDPTG